jgi:pilus assembly protein CpaF
MSTVEADLLDRIRVRLAERGADATHAQVAAALRAEGRLVGDSAVLEVVDALRLDSVGAGPLEPLLQRVGVTDVIVNGPHEVYVDIGQGLQRTDVSFVDDSAVRRLAQRLAAAAGRRLDDAAPFVDVRLRDGTRFHAALAPVARPGTCLSLRVPARRGLSLTDLVAAGSMSAAGADLLLELVRRRVAFLVSGGTGSGKTTLLAALLSEVDPRERLVIVEDASELRPRHPHVVSLEARPANVEGIGEISLQQLVRQALRMRPDRLVVGEVRGSEVVDMLAAMNTGHEGGCATLHANAARDVPARLEALGTAAGLPRDAVHAQVMSAVDVVVHLRRSVGGARWLSEIAVISRVADGLVEAVPAVEFTRRGEPTTGDGAPLLERLLGTGGRR